MRARVALRTFARAARYRWKLNRAEIAWMLGVVPRGGCAVDVGAHKGAYSYWLGRRVGRAGRVLAVEPQGRVGEGLAGSMAACGLGWVEVVHAAASDRAGEGVINIPRDSTHGASLESLGGERAVDAVGVRLVTVDGLVEGAGWERFDFLKVDAEGHELAVVAGALGSLARFGAAVLVESEARAHGGGRSHIEALEGMLGPLGYEGKFHDGRRWRGLAELEVERHQAYGRGKFCNNLAFERVRRG